jgi:ubiquinone/menaquinone biosynthesis C-methylase UbiE
VRRKNLDGEERLRALTPKETLLRLGFRQGGSFADIGCGTGVFTIPAAEIGGRDARVYAVDISEEMLEEVRLKARTHGLSNIETVRSDAYDFKLSDLAADYVLICAVLHEIGDQPRFLREALRICKKGGKLAVIEFSDADSGFGPPPALRMQPEQVRELLKTAGFVNMEEIPVGEAFYAVTATR